MKIHFFEEYPDETTFERIASLPFPSLVYVAAHSFSEFLEWREKLSLANPNVEIAYWPLLPKSYWFSAFSSPDELLEFKNELMAYADPNSNQDLNSKPLQILLDLELPLLHPELFLKNLFSGTRNKKIIKEILSLARTRPLIFATAEYPWTIGGLGFLARWLGISYDQKKYPHKRIVMCYTSMTKRGLGPFGSLALRLVRSSLRKEPGKYAPDTFAVGLGTIAQGVLGNEPILSSTEFGEDLTFCKQIGIEEVVIFRLAGFSQEYLHVAARYL